MTVNSILREVYGALIASGDLPRALRALTAHRGGHFRSDDRQGLLRDITSVLAAMHIDVVSTVARADAAGETASVSICMRVRDILQLARAVDRLRRIPSVRDVRRS